MTNELLLTATELERVARALSCDVADIQMLGVNKKRFQNKNVIIAVADDEYEVRVITEHAINVVDTLQEKLTHELISQYKFDTQTVCLDEDGFKISKLMKNSHTCDYTNWYEVAKCMEVLRDLHKFKLKPNIKTFDAFAFGEWYRNRIDDVDDKQYSFLRLRCKRVYDLLKEMNRECVFSHNNCAPTNFLINNDDYDTALINWEWSGLHDPLGDVASFAVYANYTETKIDKLCEIYFGNEKCTKENILIVKAYCAILGFCLYNKNLCYEKYFNVCELEHRNKMFKFANEYSKAFLRSV